MDKEDKIGSVVIEPEAREGFKYMLAVMTGAEYYGRVNPEWEEPYAVDFPGPLRAGAYLEYVGSEGITASIGPWIKVVARRIAELWHADPPVTRLRRIELDADAGESGHHMLFFSVVFPYGGEVMVGGCTDFSGEGGRGGARCAQFLDLLSLLYGVPVETFHGDNSLYEAFATKVRSAYGEAFASDES